MVDDVRPVLSIIMPSRNRSEYAVSAIRSVLFSKSDRMELIVQDNSDNNDTQDVVAAISDPRLVYNHTPEPLDVVRNFTIALEHARGEYVCFIGDDDAVNPEIIDAALWASQQGYDALLPTRPAHYWWPDLKFRYYGDRFSGSLELTEFSGAISFPDPDQEMFKSARRAGQDFCDLPKVYYGIVRRECLDKVYEKTGTYFPGPSPDMAGAMSVANFVKKMCKVDYPLFVPGSSGKSTAGLGAMKKHEGRLEDQRHLPKDIVADWSEIVPRFFAGCTIWGEDAVRALRAIGREDVFKEYNIPKLHAMCAVFNLAYLGYTCNHLYSALGSVKRNKILGTVMFAYYYLHAWSLRFGSLLRRFRNSKKQGANRTIPDQETIEVAVNTLLAELKKSNSSFLGMVVKGNSK